MNKLLQITKKIALQISRKILIFSQKGVYTFQEFPDSMSNFINSLPEPADDIERSYFQFRCNSKYNPKYLNLLINILAFITLIPSMVFFLVMYIIRKKLKSDSRTDSAVFLHPEFEKRLIPDVLNANFKNIICFYPDMKFALNWYDIYFLLRIWIKFPLSFGFLQKVVIKTAYYRYILLRFDPEAIIALAEYSFTSSILTLFCEKNKVEHINVMHGERVLSGRTTFFRFHRCYVWDIHYENLFKRLRTTPNQFIIAIPPALVIETEKYRKADDYVDFKYYMAAPSMDESLKLVQLIKELQKIGYIIKIRPHPLHLETIDAMKQFLKEDTFESINVSIEESISNTNNVIGVISTVLLQAYLNGKKVFLDDIVYKSRVEKLKELSYILASKTNVNMLSSLNIKMD